MKTIKHMLSVFCSLVLLGGCVGPVDELSEEDDATLGDELPGVYTDALSSCVYPADSGGGVRTNATGCFMWGDTVVNYTSKGAVQTTSAAMSAFSTPAKSGDFEILAFGASHGGDGSQEVNTYFDKAKMEGQKFQAISVRGSQDKKIELWVRKNTGQTTINPPSKARAYNVIALNGSDVVLNLGTITKATVQSASSTAWSVPPLADATRLNVLAYFGDDSFEVLSSGGEMVFNKWGFGDGDSLNVIFYAPDDAPPATISVKRHDSGGSQYVGIRGHFRRM